MSDLPPKPAPTRTTGLSPKEQKLAALRAKLAGQADGAKATNSPGSQGLQSKGTLAGKKTSFQRKAT